MSRIAILLVPGKVMIWWWWNELILENRVPCFGTNQCFIHGMRLGHVEKGMAVRNPQGNPESGGKISQSMAIYGNLWQSMAIEKHCLFLMEKYGKGLIHRWASHLWDSLRQQLLKLQPSVRCRCPALGGCPSRLDELRTLTSHICGKFDFLQADTRNDSPTRAMKHTLLGLWISMFWFLTPSEMLFLVSVSVLSLFGCFLPKDCATSNFTRLQLATTASVARIEHFSVLWHGRCVPDSP